MLVFLILCGSQGPLPGDLASSVYLYVRLFIALAVICLLSIALFTWIEDPARRVLRAVWRKPGFLLVPGLVNAVAIAAAVVLVVQNGLVVARAGRSIASSGVQIVSATYGGNCRAAQGNVTLKVQADCQGQAECDYVVNTYRLSDPAPGCGKNFAVSFTCAPRREVYNISIPGEAGLGSVARLNCNGTLAKPAAH